MGALIPDKWVLVRVNDDVPFYKILAGWDGGYLKGQSWKINSGVKSVEVKEDKFKIHGFSSSVYDCEKKFYGTNSIMNTIISNFNDLATVLDKKEALKILEEWKTNEP